MCRWEYDAEHYCSDVRRTPLYETGPLLLDIIDTCVFDFIIGNADRHRYEVFENDPRSMLIMFDNGKRYNIQGGPEETEAMNSWPYQIAKCQILTNFQKKSLEDSLINLQ